MKIRYSSLFFLGVLFLTISCENALYAQVIAHKEFVSQADSAPNIPLLPVITMEDLDPIDQTFSTPSFVPLSANKSSFYTIAGYQFLPFRYRPKGYPNRFFSTYINGLPLDAIDYSLQAYAVMGYFLPTYKNNRVVEGQENNRFGIGNLGTTQNIDLNPFQSKATTIVDYDQSNRSFKEKLMVFHSSPLSKKYWKYNFGIAGKLAPTSYYPGTYTSGINYAATIGKQFNLKSKFFVSAIGNYSVNALPAATIQETRDLTKNVYYNPNWGFQNGQKRNARIATTQLNTFIVNYQYQPTNRTQISLAAMYLFGSNSLSGLEWFNAADPRPDYYRYLPSNQSDSFLQKQVAQGWVSNINTQQIDWDKLYAVNQNNIQFIDGKPLRSAAYILSKHITNTQRGAFAFIANTKLNSNLFLDAGLTLVFQKNHYYKIAQDMLGSDFVMDWNLFAQRDFPNNSTVLQNNLQQPNKVVKQGDQWGNNYALFAQEYALWSQLHWSKKKWNIALGILLNPKIMYRVGYNQSGLFPIHSFGKSDLFQFVNYSLKTNITYAINGRGAVRLNAIMRTNAPSTEDMFLSVQTRNTAQPNLKNESLYAAELSYTLSTPKLQIKTELYYTYLKNQREIRSFYNDELQSFVHTGISDISQQMMGFLAGGNWKCKKNLQIEMAFAIAENTFLSNQKGLIAYDNQTTVLPIDTLFTKDFRLGNTPQAIYSFGIKYMPMQNFSLQLNANGTAGSWTSINPVRRTKTAVDGLAYNGAEWNAIIDQQRLPNLFMLNAFVYYSFRLPKKWILKKTTYLSLSGSVNNILNEQKPVIGYEQNRFDFVHKDPNTFPTKYVYQMGRNYLLSLNIRF